MNRTFWWIVAIVIVIVAIWASVRGSRNNNPDASGTPNPSASSSMSPLPGSSGNPSTTGAPSSGTGASTYTTLVAQYQGQRIQFDKLCQAIPAVTVFKTGTKVMFDNRSGDARIITIGDTKYNFAGYGYRIIKLGSANLPATVNLDCGSAIHVGTITVEK